MVNLAIKLTPKQQKGGFLASVLDGLGIPMLISVSTGKILPVDEGKGRQRNTVPVYVPQQAPPFIGSWENPTGLGLRKRKKFLNKQLSNIDFSSSLRPGSRALTRKKRFIRNNFYKRNGTESKFGT